MRKQRKLGPKRVLKTASELLITLKKNDPNTIWFERDLYFAIDTLSTLAGNAKPYNWVGNNEKN